MTAVYYDLGVLVRNNVLLYNLLVVIYLLLNLLGLSVGLLQLLVGLLGNLGPGGLLYGLLGQQRLYLLHQIGLLCGSVFLLGHRCYRVDCTRYVLLVVRSDCRHGVHDNHLVFLVHPVLQGRGIYQFVFTGLGLVHEVVGNFLNIIFLRCTAAPCCSKHAGAHANAHYESQSKS